jgi:hypothetical protein
MHKEGLVDFCGAFKIFTVIESAPGVESTRNEDRCSAVSVVNILKQRTFRTPRRKFEG